ncbi:ParB/RepB/Spo0J family partition protein [Sanguibacter sp. HDW7]|uniref:ParB/RepB/Spo0J family partition protein n=1 Tax=Sanguibacter sp. HDW7 TaxID=2714931 RepID=UPI00140D2591|nr:ParB/RepB/Spo0J family partition protein [Sanguibacter sp. HDW7]QIK83088.1 ParB/RepB/Spo0J family partition protein [Sanguibacter sp. HDW7]
MAAIPRVPIDRIQPNPRNVRRDLGDLTELAASIRARGIQQPLVIVPQRSGRPFLLLDGHRRLAAAKAAGLEAVPCIASTDTTDEQQTSHMIAAALHKGLNPVEQAEAFARLTRRGRTPADIARLTGYSTSTVSERLSLLELPAAVRAQVARREVTTRDGVDMARQIAATGRGEARVRSAARAAWFTKTHALAPRLACTHAGARRVVGPACGPCWEQAIRDDERAKVTAAADVPADEP